MKTRMAKRAMTLAAMMVVLLAGLVLAADTTTLQGYEIEFLGATQDGTNSTWTYAISTTGVETSGLSHWTLAVGSCATVVAPSPGSYTTPTDHERCGQDLTCLEATYNEVEIGDDPTTGVSGVKFGDANEEQLSQSNGGTHIFEIVLAGVFADETEDIAVGVKTGAGGTAGVITGASCGSPSAVAMSTAAAESDSGTPLVTWLLLVAILMAASILVLRRSDNIA